MAVWVMADIINLRQRRKAVERAEAAAKASENRVRHGRTKAERESARLQTDQERRRLDGLKRDEPGE